MVGPHCAGLRARAAVDSQHSVRVLDTLAEPESYCVADAVEQTHELGLPPRSCKGSRTEHQLQYAYCLSEPARAKERLTHRCQLALVR